MVYEGDVSDLKVGNKLVKWSRRLDVVLELTVICTMASFVAPARPNKRFVPYSSPSDVISAVQNDMAAMTAVETRYTGRRPNFLASGMNKRQPRDKPTNMTEEELLSWPKVKLRSTDICYQKIIWMEKLEKMLAVTARTKAKLMVLRVVDQLRGSFGSVEGTGSRMTLFFAGPVSSLSLSVINRNVPGGWL